MKSFLSGLITTLVLSISTFAQSPIAIEEVKVPGGIEFIAHSQSDSDVELTLSLSQLKKVKGYTKPVTEIIPAGEAVKILRIKTFHGYTYKYEIELVMSSPSTRSTADLPSKNSSYDKSLDKGIVLFHQTTCQRCTYAGNYLVENGVPFTPLDIADAENNALMWKKLREQGFTGSGFQTPAIMVDGEISHSHKNIKKFMSQLVGSVR